MAEVFFGKANRCFRQQARWCKVSPAATYFEKAKVGKAFWGFQFPQTPKRCGRIEKFAQPKSGKLAHPMSGVAWVVFVIGRWLNKLSFIDCSDSAAFFTAEQIFLKLWEARAFSFTSILGRIIFLAGLIFFFDQMVGEQLTGFVVFKVGQYQSRVREE